MIDKGRGRRARTRSPNAFAGIAGHFCPAFVLSLVIGACGSSPSVGSSRGGAGGPGGSSTGGVGTGSTGGGAGRGGVGTGGFGVSDAGTDASAGNDGPSSRPALCSLPFEAGNCLAAFRVFTAGADGVCVSATYGGCGGNDNRFTTIEQCMATCEGRPNPLGCPTDRIAKRICVACGPAGGCGQEAEVCAQPCTTPTGCPPSLSVCTGGVCQVAGCI